MVTTEQVTNINSRIDFLVDIFTTVVTTEKEDIVTFTKDDLEEFRLLFDSEIFVKLLTKKSLSQGIVVMAKFDRDSDLLIAVASTSNFLEAEKDRNFSSNYKVSKEEVSRLRNLVLEHNAKLN